MSDDTKPVREWTTPDGHKCYEMPDGSNYLPREVLARFVMGLDPAACSNPIKRAAIERFQREAAMLNPAAQHRRVVQLFDEIGEPLPDVLRELPPKIVK